MQRAIDWLISFKMYTYNEFRDTLKNLYILLIDFIYFDNQNMLMGFKIKELADIIIGDREDGPQPYNYFNAQYKDILNSALSELNMKYFMDHDKLMKIKEEIISNEDLSLDVVSEYGSLMDMLRKYSKEEKYID